MKILGIEVLVTNDGKEKYQSFEASIQKSIYTAVGNVSFDATAYGESESEAIENLKTVVSQTLAPKGVQDDLN